MTHHRLATAIVVALASVTLMGGCARNADQAAAAPAPAAPEAAAPAAPAAATYPTRVYFGDTHLHTALSLDAGASGTLLVAGRRLPVRKGRGVTGASGQKAKLSRPLDFLVVADHSDQMGLITDLKAGKPAILANPMAKAWYD
jgi:hypothetical protein